jgi:hypothetical protein
MRLFVTGIHTRTDAATNLLGDRKSCHSDTFHTRKKSPSLSGIRPKTLRCTVLRSSTDIWVLAKRTNAAGLEVPESPHDGRRGVLRALRDAFAQQSDNDLSEKLKLHAVYYFGSLRKAKAALKTDRRFRAGWSTRKIIATIRERHRLGKPLDYTAVRQDDPALVSAAEAYFGSWGNALYAAGIDPNRYLRRKWRERTTPAKRNRPSYGNVFKPDPVHAVMAI